MVVAIEDKPVVGLPAVGVNCTAFEDFCLYYWHQDDFADRCHDRHEDLAASLEQPEDWGFASGSTTSPALNPTSAEIGLVDLYFTGEGPSLLCTAMTIYALERCYSSGLPCCGLSLSSEQPWTASMSSQKYIRIFSRLYFDNPSFLIS